jgi:hypothetical protein
MATPPDPSRTDPTDPLPPEVFANWESALEENLLKPKQIEALQTMVDEGRAATLADAASILDLQESIIHPPEHMWGP